MREAADEAVDLAVLGDEPDAGVEDLAHRPADQLLAVERDRALDVVLEAEEGLGELGLAVALDAGHGEHLAGLDGEADAVEVDLADGVDDAQVLDDQGVVAELRVRPCARSARPGARP